MDNLFEQMANITKAHAYDLVAKHRNELAEQNESYRKALNEVLDVIRKADAVLLIDNPVLYLNQIVNIAVKSLKENKSL